MMSQRGMRKLDNRVIHAAIETLEKRQLLTTVHGGQQFEFVQYDDSIVRVTVDGPATAALELIGATENNDGGGGQFATLNNIPGTFTQGANGNPDRFGGLGGADGVEPINTITGAPNSLTPVNVGPIGGPFLTAPRAAIHYDAMSSNSTGKTYAISLQDAGDANQVWLTSVNYTSSGQGTVVADIAGQIVAATPGAADTQSIQSIVAADFMPGADNLLYFIAVVSVPRPPAGGGEPTETDVPFLYYYDLNAGDPSLAIGARGAPIRSDPSTNIAEVVPDVFGMTMNENGQMVLSVTGREETGSGDATGVQEKTGIVVTDVPDPSDTTPLPVEFTLNEIQVVTLDGDPVDDLRGLEAVPGDLPFVYGITGDAANSQLVHVNTNTGVAVNFGGLPDPDDQRTTKRGENLTDLVWNPRLLNAFNQIDEDTTNDSRRGALIAQDSGTDELVFIDSAQRFATTSLYHVRLTGGTPDTKVSIAVRQDNTPFAEQPFDGDIGQIRHVDAQGGNAVLHSPATGTGAVLVGLRTIDVLQSTTDEEDIPVRRIRKTPGQLFGSFPKKAKYVYAGISADGDVGDFLIGGTVLGRVTWEGNIAGSLYAGEFLTGNVEGGSEGGDYSETAGNFFVSGDARNIIARSSIGSTFTTGALRPNYVTGADLIVGGKLGQLKIGDAMYGNVTVGGKSLGLNHAISELEDRRGNPPSGQTYFEGWGSDLNGNPLPPSLGDVTDWYNDTFDTAQAVGTHYSSAYRNDEVAVINGTLDNATNVNDAIDIYKMAFMAGQTMHVRLDAQSSFNVAVFDSENRLVASDRSDIGAGVVAGKEFTYKVDRPGDYKFVVAFNSDQNFDGNPTLLIGGQQKYTLRISNAAKISLGGLMVGAGMYSFEQALASPIPNLALTVLDGDLGILDTGSNLIDATAGYDIAHGNVRSIISPEIGTAGSEGILGNGVVLTVPRGSVGLLRTTGTMELNDLNETTALNFIDPVTLLPDPTYAIGGDYQWIDCGGEFRGDVVANRAVGNFHAGSVLGGRYWIVNADRRGQDGYWGLADVTGNIGDAANGGPNIYTGPGGNFGYMQLGGVLFAPAGIGVGQRQLTEYDPGESARLTDDSGIEVKISATPRVITGSSTDPEALADPGQLSILTYPVSDTDKSGVIIVQVNLDDNPSNAANHGLLVESSSNAITGGSVEIGQINTFENGRAIVVTGTPSLDGTTTLSIKPATRDPNEGFVTPTTNSPVDLIFKGDAPINVWSIQAADRTGGALSTLDSIDNRTSGEIVNVVASGIGDLAADHIGIPQSHIGENKSHTGLALMKNAKLDLVALFGLGETPVDVADTGVILSAGGGNLAGYLVSARSRQEIGNIFVNGIIGSVVANAGGGNTKGVFEGITAPIIAGSSAIPFTGRIQSVNIGEGLAPSGTGRIPFSGLFAANTIGTIRGSSDIRGDIMVGYGGLATGADARSIQQIRLTGGSIINADIAITGDPTQFYDSSSITTIEAPDTVNNPRLEIGEITLQGRGGILGSTIRAADIGPITVSGGFGILNSAILSYGDNKITDITTDGYGIRDTQIGGGATVDSITVNGNGKDIDANWYEPSVLQSGGKEGIEPYTGQIYNELNDLHRYLGTNAKVGKKKGVTKSGIIEDSQINGTRNLGSINAYQIVGRQKTTRIQFGNQIDNVNVRHAVDNMLLSTGKLKKLTTGSDVSFSQIGVAGVADQLNIGGTFRGTTRLTVTGPQGKLNNLNVKNGLFGSVRVVNDIGTIHVGGNLGARPIRGGANMASLIVDGSVEGSTLVQINGKLSQIAVGKNVNDGAVIQAVSNDTQNVKGSLLGDIIIGPFNF